ncbi:carbohydrate ABC transporter permease [Paenibacillus sp. IB182496]|uniref:Carbohydrate ABC transporter permease n=1 Tax=Paenibacillus sabuli TaxID=2772509 RepID=A0A927BVV4_9BACL|nr:carbohydrate ABC transporter permease [Paenibacillus sabuli]MBD2847796.1 carbohydrate ABC transporter permease [Paenibacillus sabuli]
MARRSFGEKGFDVINIGLLGLVAILMVFPFLYIIALSFSDEKTIAEGGLILFPKGWSLEAYRYIFSTDTLVRSLYNSILITIGGTIVNLAMTSLMAYPLAKTHLLGRRGLLMLVIFTILFSGGLIPTFLVVKWTGLLDSLWSVIIPTSISAFYLIILKNFFQQIPEGLEESAKIDGANDMVILLRIVLPLSLPAMATFALFYAVNHWNMYFHAIMYINDNSKWPIQVLLRQIVILSQSAVGDSSSISDETVLPPQSIKMAVIVFATVPIMLVYPFLQKHFAKGVLLGSVKG